ncbi:transposable element Tc1 transposase [Trichonephila clavipes]|nr:transposable element Tc1 transposase [Trichonephila clavipes]
MRWQLEGRDENLEPYVHLFTGAVRSDFILIDDNPMPHRVHLMDEFLESEDIRLVVWSTRSSDLNPTEHAIDDLGRAIETRKPRLRAIQGLKIAMLNEGNQLP